MKTNHHNPPRTKPGAGFFLRRSFDGRAAAAGGHPVSGFLGADGRQLRITDLHARRFFRIFHKNHPVGSMPHGVKNMYSYFQMRATPLSLAALATAWATAGPTRGSKGGGLVESSRS